MKAYLWFRYKILGVQAHLEYLMGNDDLGNDLACRAYKAFHDWQDYHLLGELE